jgi:hypothetical protein
MADDHSPSIEESAATTSPKDERPFSKDAHEDAGRDDQTASQESGAAGVNCARARLSMSFAARKSTSSSRLLVHGLIQRSRQSGKVVSFVGLWLERIDPTGLLGAPKKE